MGGKNIQTMRKDLRLDLKDSGALWSDAELNRCIEKAIADLSRFLPQEKVYEESLQFTTTDETFVALATTNLTAIVNAQSLNVAGGSLLTIAGQPDQPRPLTLTMTDADNSAYGVTIIIRGMDKDELAISETFHWSRGDSKTIVGKKEFKYVYEVELDEDAGSGAGDTLSVGYGATTGGWVYLNNKHIKQGSDTVNTAASGAGTAKTRNTDYYIDYANGRIKAITLTASTTYYISYTKSQLEVDLSSLADLIRVAKVEYPVGEVPQSIVNFETWGKRLTLVTSGEQGSQSEMAEDDQIRIYYEAEHSPPGEYSPSTAPEFLENTVIMAAGAFALFIYVLKAEHQAVTDLASVRTDLAAATTAQTALGTALTNIKKYLDNNSAADAAGLLQDITDGVAAMRTAIATALDAANSYLDEVDTTDFYESEASFALIADYLTGAVTAPSVYKYLGDGDAFINTVNTGGEGATVSEEYRKYAETTKLTLVDSYMRKREDALQQATARTNAALGFVQEASQRLTNIRTHIEQAAGYSQIASIFAEEAGGRIQVVQKYLDEATGYLQAAGADLSLADRFRTEAIERRNEVWSIWRDRKQYIGQFASVSVSQPS